MPDVSRRRAYPRCGPGVQSDAVPELYDDGHGRDCNAAVKVRDGETTGIRARAGVCVAHAPASRGRRDASGAKGGER